MAAGAQTYQSLGTHLGFDAESLDAEEKALIRSAQSSSSSASSGSCARDVMFGVAGLGFVALTVLGFVSDGIKMSVVHSLASTFAKSSASPLGSSARSESSGSGPAEWTLSRAGYEPLTYFIDSDTTLKYKILDGYDAVVEPHAEMELYMPAFALSDEYYYRFSVCDADGVSNCRDGKLYVEDGNFVQETVTVPCESYEQKYVKVTKHANEDDEQLSAIKGKALCMYVRREMRSLTQDDLDLMLDSMQTLYYTDEKKGQALYGDDFHNSTYYLQAHHFNAAWQDGDHIHEGLGFLPQHIKITNLFEKAMQTVEPSVTMPYWDFTIDYAEGNIYPQDSFAFTADTFGSITPAADPEWGYTYRNDTIKGGRIPDGRFKHLEAEYNWKFDNFDQISSNYGYMRAPWNANPSPFISRFSGYTTTLPSCSDHYMWLQDSTFTDFLSDSPYSPHASLHGAVGSVMGCDLMDPLREQGLFVSAYQQNKFCQKWSFLIKELYRKNFLEGAPAGDCTYSSLDAEGQSCHFVCNKDAGSSEGDKSKYDNMPLQLENLISTTYTGTVLTTEQYEMFRDFICDGDGAKVFAGDHTESASPADPSFWPMHPTLERLTQAKFLGGGFGDTTWPSDAVNDYVCDKAQCYETDAVSGEVTLDYSEACCYGHYEGDQLLDWITPNKNAGTGETNRETMDATDASSADYSMPYIYDSFAWDHCDEDFEALLTGTSSTGANSASGKAGSAKQSSDSWLLTGDDATH